MSSVNCAAAGSARASGVAVVGVEHNVLRAKRSQSCHVLADLVQRALARAPLGVWQRLIRQQYFDPRSKDRHRALQALLCQAGPGAR